MSNRARMRATALLAAMLAAGVAVGWVGHDRYERARRHRHRGVNGLVERLAKDLDLTSAQRDSVHAIVSRNRVDIDSLWADVHPRFEAVRTRTHSEIEKLLTPEQQEKYRAIEERKEQRHRRDASPPPGAPR